MLKQWVAWTFFGAIVGMFTVGWAQMPHVPISLGKARVLSEQGLVLRERPGFSGRKLLTMPFGAEVLVVDTVRGSLDSLPTAFVFDAWTDSLQGMYEEKRVGYWVKAKYNGQVGYAFDIFLMQRAELELGTDSVSLAIAKTLKALGINQNLRILAPGSTCLDNIHWEPGWTWWGMYENGGRVSIRPVELQRNMQRMLADEHVDRAGQRQVTIYRRMSATVKQAERLMLIVGSKGNLPLRPEFRIRFPLPFDGALNYWHWNEDGGRLAATGLRVACQEEGPYRTVHCESWMEVNSAHGPIRYDVPVGFPRGELSPNVVADMDGDGALDVLASYGEEWRATVLFLSSRAKPGQICYPAAVYWSGYCC
ncbi:MAG: hypothetical protein U0176_00500 [Bacteroidia bacterium]